MEYTPQHFAVTRDNLPPASLVALVDFAEGNIFALFCERYVYGALLDRGLIKNFFDGQKTIGLTEYGEQFIAWYRQPRDLPGQLSLFDDNESSMEYD